MKFLSSTLIVTREDKQADNFGGCQRLKTHYTLIGQALKNCEVMYGCRFSTWKLKARGQERAEVAEQFRQESVFVPTEVLESYLDDLLNLSKPDGDLFISPGTACVVRQKLFTGICAFGTLALLVGDMIHGAIYKVLVLLLGLGSTVGLSALLRPQGSIRRRMYFCQIVSQEISRRRGRGAKLPLWAQPRQVIEQLFQSGEYRPLHGAAARRVTPMIH